jgi:4-alpha-glucanotransferase
MAHLTGRVSKPRTAYSLSATTHGTHDQNTFRIYPNPSNGTLKNRIRRRKDLLRLIYYPSFLKLYNLNLARFASGAYTIQLKMKKELQKKLMNNH